MTNEQWQQLLAVLEEKEYRGYLTIKRENAGDPLAEVGQGIEYLRNVML